MLSLTISLPLDPLAYFFVVHPNLPTRRVLLMVGYCWLQFDGGDSIMRLSLQMTAVKPGNDRTAWLGVAPKILKAG
jgi:hypothetical protein